MSYSTEERHKGVSSDAIYENEKIQKKIVTLIDRGQTKKDATRKSNLHEILLIPKQISEKVGVYFWNDDLAVCYPASKCMISSEIGYHIYDALSEIISFEHLQDFYDSEVLSAVALIIFRLYLNLVNSQNKWVLNVEEKIQKRCREEILDLLLNF